MTPGRRIGRSAIKFGVLGAFLSALPVLVLAATYRQEFIQVVSPGQSIQAAINRAAPNGWIFVRPGTYHETADATNGLNISTAVNLVGLSTSQRRVVVENSGGQLNGIVVVPSDRTGCMNCHSTMAPPFNLRPGVATSSTASNATIRGLTISGITIRGFVNNGLFTESVDGFLIDDVESLGNKDYGIFPTRSTNGILSHNRVTGSEDAGLWVETSKNVRISNNLVEDNVIGMEISNSDNILATSNESRNNSVGLGIFLLAGLFDTAPGAKNITIERNFIHDNNKANDATPGSLASELPAGIGLIFTGPDDSRIVGNRLLNNGLTGIVLVDVCVGFAGGPHDCSLDPTVTPSFLADQDVTNTRLIKNVLRNNGTEPGSSPFAFAASDIALLSFGAGNCASDNNYGTTFSLTGPLPPCS